MNKLHLRTKKSLGSTIAKEDGLTLIEVAIALVIISIVSLYFLSYFTNSEAQSKLTNQKLSATHLSNAELHKVQAIPFNDLEGRLTASNCTQLPEQTSNEIYVIDTQICRNHPKYTSNPDVLYITITTSWAPDKDQPGQYKHKVSIVGAAKKNYAIDGGK